MRPFIKTICIALLFLLLFILMPYQGALAQSPGGALASLTLSPSPLWYPGPVGGRMATNMVAGTGATTEVWAYPPRR